MPPKPRLIPGYRSNWARSATESTFPELWRGKVGQWGPVLGPTGTILRDLSGRGNNGTLANMEPATDWQVEEQGHVLDFDGSDEHIVLASSKIPNLSSGSVSAWAVIDTTAADGIIFDLQTPRIVLLIRSSDEVRLHTAGDQFNTSKKLTSGQYHFLCVTWNSASNSRFIYIDGAEEASSTNSIDTTADPSGGAILYSRFSGSAAPVDGRLACLTLYNRVLSANEVRLAWEVPYADLIPKSRVLGKAAAAAASIAVLRRRYEGY